MSRRDLVRIGRVARVPELLWARQPAGRYMRVVYIPDPGPDSVFVITAYEMTGRPLAASRKRRRKKRQ